MLNIVPNSCAILIASHASNAAGTCINRKQIRFVTIMLACVTCLLRPFKYLARKSKVSAIIILFAAGVQNMAGQTWIDPYELQDPSTCGA